MSEWQPIETAPKDGTHILLFIKSDVYGSSWQAVGCWSNIDDDNKYLSWLSPLGDGRQAVDSCTSSPTHWMPLPKPPEGV